MGQLGPVGARASHNETLVAFGQNVRRWRDNRGLTQERLAELSGLHPTYISSLERGQRNVGIINVVALAGALGVPPGHLVEGLA